MTIIKTDKPPFVFSLEADKDYLLARLLSLSGDAFNGRAGFFGQQAIEKYIKALSVQTKKEFLKTHDLLELWKYLSENSKDLGLETFELDDLKIFNAFLEVGRYGAESKFDPLAQKNDEFETAGVIIWSNGYLEKLDEIVFKLRSKIEYKDFSNSLAAILVGDERDIIVGMWKLPIGLRDILIHNNKYFSGENAKTG